MNEHDRTSIHEAM